MPSDRDTKIKILVIILFLLTFFAGMCIQYAWGGSPAQNVIGECTIDKDVKLDAVLYKDGVYIKSWVQAFEKQKVYVLSKSPNGEYFAADAQGFIHNCPIHGREIVEYFGVVRIKADAPGVSCQIF